MAIISFLKQLIGKSEKTREVLPGKKDIISAADHGILEARISPNAIKVLRQLKQAGYQAYLVGGGVRDLLLGLIPKDFDVATDASPEKVRRIFRNCRLIGRRFRLAHVYFGHEIIEVATFRASHHENSNDIMQAPTGMLLRDNVYGTMEEDAWRRDFTINALYYDIANHTIIDFTGGMIDLKKRFIHTIGNPAVRYHEDPVRMLRAIRLAAKLDLTIEASTAAPIKELCGLLLNVSSARLFDEIIKLFYCGKSVRVYEMLRQYGVFAVLFPQTEACLIGEEEKYIQQFLIQALTNTDKRITQNLGLNPAFLLSVMFWFPLKSALNIHMQHGKKLFIAINLAMNEVISHFLKYIAAPKRFTSMMREIWLLQFQLIQRNSRQVYRILYHPRFRAAYDFLLLRAEAGEAIEAHCEWWEQFQIASPEDRQKMTQSLSKHSRRRKRKKKRTDVKS